MWLLKVKHQVPTFMKETTEVDHMLPVFRPIREKYVEHNESCPHYRSEGDEGGNCEGLETPSRIY